MKEIPAEIRVFYDALLVQKKIPEKPRFYYKKWLRYYLDFCFKYGCNQSNRESLSYFIKKLKEKNQTEQQQKQALHAISIYFDIEFTNKDKKIPLENKKRILSSKKGELKTTNADWRPVYSGLNAEIKLRHYSPRTFQSYRGWARQLQGFTQSKDPQLLAVSDVKDFYLFSCKTEGRRFNTKPGF